MVTGDRVGSFELGSSSVEFEFSRSSVTAVGPGRRRQARLPRAAKLLSRGNHAEAVLKIGD